MIVNVTVSGDRELIERFHEMPAAVNQALYVKVMMLALKLEKLVKTGKLNGQVLNRITGALSRSIHNVVDRNKEAVIGRVFSSGDVKYAGIHEYGGTTKAHIIEPKKANVLFCGKAGGPQGQAGPYKVFAKRVNHPGSKMPERSFLRSSLHDMSTEISMGLKEAAIAAVRKQVSG